MPLALAAAAAPAAPLGAPVVLGPYTAMPAPRFAVWNPAADYITPGQDEPGYRRWYAGAPWRPVYVRSFNNYLVQNGVGGIVPTWQLLRTATSWSRCGGQPFEVPPASEWPHIVQTLRYIYHQVVPAVGPVEPVSGYRNPLLNDCAGGAPESSHKQYSAIDLVPLRPTNRQELISTLCTVHAHGGDDYHVGLGFYSFLRFHVDTTKYRRWGADSSVSAACAPIARTPVVALAPQQPQQQPQSSAPVDPLAPIGTTPATVPAVPPGAPAAATPQVVQPQPQQP